MKWKQINSTYLSHYVQSQAFWIHYDYCKDCLNHQCDEVVQSKHQSVALHAQIYGDLEPKVRLAVRYFTLGGKLLLSMRLIEKCIIEVIPQGWAKWCFICLIAPSSVLTIGVHFNDFVLVCVAFWNHIMWSEDRIFSSAFRLCQPQADGLWFPSWASESLAISIGLFLSAQTLLHLVVLCPTLSSAITVLKSWSWI